MDELDESEVASVGEQLRVAREQKGLSLEDVANQTRIPRRHLESIEASEWSKLPAPTYTVGFAKSYASAIGLDRVAIGDQLRAEMGGTRPDYTTSEVFEPADPARTMPKWLVFSAIAAIALLVVVMTWLNNRSLAPADAPEEATAAAVQPTSTPLPPPPAPGQRVGQGPVVLTATETVWIQVRDGANTLYEGELAAGQVYQVPATATAPLLKAGKPEALRVTVGSAVAPAVGPAGQVASDVSLLGPDLMRSGTTPPANAAAAATNGAAGQ